MNYSKDFVNALNYNNDKNDKYKDEEVDNDPMQSDYSRLIKSSKELGFSNNGSYKSQRKNVKSYNKIVTGLFDEQTKLVKNNNAIGTKLAYNTGFMCKDSQGNEQPQYTYLDNSGNPELGLMSEVGNSTGKIFGRVGDLFSAMGGIVDDSCSEVNLKIITNSGKETNKKVHIQNSEIENIDEENFVKEKNKKENFTNINNLLLDDELFYKDMGIFSYLILINFLFLYYIFILVINN